MKKRAKTEILGNKTDIFMFGKQPESTSYSKSINRQILKNINLTNNNKMHKEISLVNKKILNYQFNINNNLNNKKVIKHTSTNSQNLTEIKINKIGPFPIKEMMKKNGGAIYSVNKTERTSRNHSKDKINKINNTTVKRNNLDSFSPRNAKEVSNNKINKNQNEKSSIVYSFLKNMNSSQKIKNLKNRKNANYSNINNNINFQGVGNLNNKKIINSKNY